MSIKSFLSSKKERRAWHRGIYKGLWKYWNPRTLIREEFPPDFRIWEDREGHYEDVPMTFFFLVKWYGIIGLLYVASELGVLKELLALARVMIGG